MADATQTNVEAAERFLKAVESGATGAELAAFFSPGVVQVEFPNRLTPRGARRDLAQLLDGAQRGQRALSAQRYDICNCLASGDQVAVEIEWTGTLAIDFGELKPGTNLHAYIAVFLEFEDGKIKVQRNYDCYQPF